MLGNISLMFFTLTRKTFTSPCLRDLRKKALNATTKQLASGLSMFQPTISSTATSTTTSGRWATQVPAVLAPKSMSILAQQKRKQKCQGVNSLIRMTLKLSKSGTSYSCSTTAKRMALSNHFLCTSSIRVWASNAWCACCRVRTPTTTPIFSNPSSRKRNNYPALLMERKKMLMWPCVWLLTISVPSLSPLLTVSCPVMRKRVM